ncbi:hypothetical protein AAFF_G00332340 [Aldrovandia affinis]|uniref:Uncharacterized protein n=1 Tax=Aldrovandia affinis TaxID=143900 RepID=A0AAD7WPU4_9TELE|nr:hypothetical protein AAFF_G00332340 [Aldrovandia affinis]
MFSVSNEDVPYGAAPPNESRVTGEGCASVDADRLPELGWRRPSFRPELQGGGCTRCQQDCPAARGPYVGGRRMGSGCSNAPAALYTGGSAAARFTRPGGTGPTGRDSTRRALEQSALPPGLGFIPRTPRGPRRITDTQSGWGEGQKGNVE